MRQLDPELEQELRLRINPIYADVKGTESYERKRLLDEIDLLREELQLLRDSLLQKENG